MNPTIPDTPISRRNEDIVKAYLAGETLAVIGERYDLSRERIRQILDELNVKRRSQRHIHESERTNIITTHGQRINDLFTAKRSIAEVIRELKGQVPERIVREVLAPRRHEQVAVRPAVKRFTDDDIIAAIQQADTAGARSVNTYRAWRDAQDDRPSMALITLRFGSWSNARTKAGLVSRNVPARTCRVFSDTDITAALDRFADACLASGRTPSAQGYDIWAKHLGNMPTLSTVRARTNTTWSSLMAKRWKVKR